LRFIALLTFLLPEKAPTLNQQDMVRWVVKQSNKKMFRLPLLPDTHWFWHMILLLDKQLKKVEEVWQENKMVKQCLAPQLQPHVFAVYCIADILVACKSTL